MDPPQRMNTASRPKPCEGPPRRADHRHVHVDSTVGIAARNLRRTVSQTARMLEDQDLAGSDAANCAHATLAVAG